MSGLAAQRLAEERKIWRKTRPFGFQAKPVTRKDGSVDMMVWECIVPGKEGTVWEGGNFPISLTFPSEYPAKPPVAKFPAGFYHMNVYPDGKVCLSILDDDDEMGGQWAVNIGLRQILEGIQELLTGFNPKSPAQDLPFKDWKKSESLYEHNCRVQARKYASIG